ncbi:MAG: CDP-alcohol phosphatidyltransferase family protein [Lachnospiraceae bacterium]|nr:CDP-alcohol phosphatidyltransferase family protein [Lachnospiraceae bacterium]
MLDTHARKYADKLITPGAKLFRALKWKPTHVTILALVVGEAAAATFLFKLPVVVPILLLWVSGYLDTVDGALARLTKQTSPVGTLLDIFFDRIVELSFILAFAIRYPDSVFAQLLSVSAIVLSMTVFLTSGALLENNGVKSFRYQTGLMERTEGFIFFTIQMILGQYMKYTSFIYGGLIFFTAIQRLVLTVVELKKSGSKEK